MLEVEISQAEVARETEVSPSMVSSAPAGAGRHLGGAAQDADHLA